MALNPELFYCDVQSVECMCFPAERKPHHRPAYRSLSSPYSKGCLHKVTMGHEMELARCFHNMRNELFRARASDQISLNKQIEITGPEKQPWLNAAGSLDEEM